MRNHFEYRSLCGVAVLLFFLSAAIAAEPEKKVFDMSSMAMKKFIAFWRDSAGREAAASQPFIGALWRQLGKREPDAPRQDETKNGYVYEKRVRIVQNGKVTTGRADAYKQRCFVWESKHYENPAPVAGNKGIARGTSRWDKAMLAALSQGEIYARTLSAEEGHVPFLFISDIAYTIDIYVDFQGRGIYTHYRRIYLEDLEKSEVRELLITIWEDPLSLDPSRKAEQVTNQIAYELSDLAASLEKSGHSPDATAMFIMRCIFSMFAEDINIIPQNTFVGLLENYRDDPEGLRLQLSLLWLTMRNGGYFPPAAANLPRVGGYLFADNDFLVPATDERAGSESGFVLPLEADQHETLIRAAKTNWSGVQPSIFGTLLEWVFSKTQRQRLQVDHRRVTTERQSMGAHYTPPVYVERLVIPTVIEPLRRQWHRIAEAAMMFVENNDYDSAIRAIGEFHKYLCEDVTVLDPSCGGGNILVIAQNLIFELETEVLEALRDLGAITHAFDPNRPTVKPGQFHGIEVNIHAAAISELVLLIANLQNHYKRYGAVAADPIIGDIRSIEHRDAIFEHDGIVDGVCVNPRRAAPWPRVKFIVGNPPFIGTVGKMREALGDPYVAGLFKAYPELSDSVNFVCYWVHRAAEMVRTGPSERFGLITTATIRQKRNRSVLRRHLDAEPPLSLLAAVPDHPWIDSKDGANVRIAMLVGGKGTHMGVLSRVVEEKKDSGIRGLRLAR